MQRRHRRRRADDGQGIEAWREAAAEERIVATPIDGRRERVQAAIAAEGEEGLVELTCQRYADVLVAVPVGRLDHGSAGDFERALLPLLDPPAGGEAGLVLDFARVDYLSSVGLRVLMVAAKRIRGRGARIAVAALQPIVAEIFAISRFHSVLDVHATVPAALQAISPAAHAVHSAAGAGAR